MSVGDDKDRYGDKLRRVGIARENQWAAERDRTLLDKIRRKSDERTKIEKSRAKKEKVFAHLLCPIDFEECSLKALEFAGRLAAQNDATLCLIHVCAVVFVPLGGIVTDRVKAEQSAKRRLKKVAGRHLPDVPCDILITTGDAAESIIAVQSGLHIDLIVMGTHGRSTVPRLLLGSVAERVVREAACPVLTIRHQ